MAISIKFKFADDNIISFNKNYVLVGHDKPINGLKKIVTLTDDVAMNGLDPSNLFKYIRYSYDKKSWSMWNEYTNSLDQYIMMLLFNCKNVYFEFKYVYNDNNLGNVDLGDKVVINQIDLGVEICDIDIDYSVIERSINMKSNISPSYVKIEGAGINVYDVGGFEELAKDMSYLVNSTFGFESLYFQTLPDDDSADFIFKEWVLYKYVKRRCIKVVTNDNQLPNNMPLFNVSGDQWDEPFDVHIDDRLFKEIFGATTEPRRKDLIYLPITNRLYTVNGVFMQRGFMNMPMYWVINLVKFQPNINYVEDNENSKFIDNLILTEETQLNDLLTDQIDDVVNDQQNSSSTTSFDETRLNLAGGLDIYNYKKTFNYVDLIYNYYNLSVVSDANLPAVVYKYKHQLDDDVKNLTYFNLFNITDIGDVRFLNNDGGDGLVIGGSYNNDLDINIDVNNNSYTATISGVEMGKWYVMFAGISFEFNQVSLYIYEMVDDAGDMSNFRDMKYVYSKVWNGGVTSYNYDEYYKLYGSNLLMTNIRMFNKLFGEEEHEFIASSYIYRKESDLIFIDNCRPQLNTPFIMRKK